MGNQKILSSDGQCPNLVMNVEMLYQQLMEWSIIMEQRGKQSLRRCSDNFNDLLQKEPDKIVLDEYCCVLIGGIHTEFEMGAYTFGIYWLIKAIELSNSLYVTTLSLRYFNNYVNMELH
eukprot:231681_1